MALYELMEVITVVGGFIAIVSYCIKAALSYRERWKKNALEDKRFEERMAEYYNSLGQQTDHTKRLDLFTVLSMKTLLDIKDESYVQHVINRLFLLPSSP